MRTVTLTALRMRARPNCKHTNKCMRARAPVYARMHKQTQATPACIEDGQRHNHSQVVQAGGRGRWRRWNQAAPPRQEAPDFYDDLLKGEFATFDFWAGLPLQQRASELVTCSADLGEPSRSSWHPSPCAARSPQTWVPTVPVPSRVRFGHQAEGSL